MTTLIRWNPTRETKNLMNVFNEFDRALFDRPARWQGPTNWGFDLDVAEKDDIYTVKASVPGIAADDLEITLEDNVLTVKGNIAKDETFEKENYHIRERRTGSFSRTVNFPVDVNVEAIEATHENGVLTLTVPKAETVKPKRIEVKVNGRN